MTRRNPVRAMPPEIPSGHKIVQRRQRRRARRRRKIQRHVRAAIRDAMGEASADCIQGADDALATLRLLQQIDLSKIACNAEGGCAGETQQVRGADGSVHLPRLRLSTLSKPDRPCTLLAKKTRSAASLRDPVLVRSSSSPGHVRRLSLSEQHASPFSTTSEALVRQYQRASREELARRRMEKTARLRALLS